MRKTVNTFKEAAGIFYEDRFVPLIEIVLNIVVSIILAKLIGLAGVFIGTIASSVVLFFYSYPVFVYKKLFGRGYFDFIKEIISYLILSIGCMAITAFITNLILMPTLIATLVVNFIICLIVPNLIYYIIFGRTEEFKYYINLIKMIKNRKKLRNS